MSQIQGQDNSDDIREQDGELGRFELTPPAPPAWLIQKIIKLAGGSTTLCCSHGYPELPLALARGGQCIVLLERSAEDAASLMDKAAQQQLLTGFQIYLESPREMLSRSIDLFNLVVFGPTETLSLDWDVLAGYRKRLLPGGITCLFGIEQKNMATVSDKLIVAGFNIDEKHDIQSGGRRLIPSFLRPQSHWVAITATSTKKKG